MKTLRRMRMGREERGAQLLELALVLPMLLVLIAGVIDFAHAWNVRQILANAARDGARLGANQSDLDLSNTPPPSIQTICEQVANYLTAEHIGLAFMNNTTNNSTTVSGVCSSPDTVANTTCAGMATTGTCVPTAWYYYSTGTYGSPDAYGLTIERSVEAPGGAGTSTRVTLSYPYHWAAGFNQLVQMLGPSNYPSKIPIHVYSTIQNLAN